MTRLVTLKVRVGHIEGGVWSWMDFNFKQQDRRVQIRFDIFELRMTQ